MVAECYNPTRLVQSDNKLHKHEKVEKKVGMDRH
jgi:hypothetical protein